jgi:ankyrin repeat protein
MTRYRLLAVCLGLIAFMASARAAPAKDLSGIYSPEVLNYWKNSFTPLIEKIKNDDLAPALSAQGRRELAATSIELPTSTATNDPFEDVTSASHTITIPVLTIKFVYDLMAAHEWLTAHGLEDHSMLYVSALKYQDASRFPGGRYLPPLDALGVPHSRMMEPADDSETMRRGLPVLFVGALAFILAHEFQHILEPAKNLSVWERELTADYFALRMVGRAEYSPVGVFWYFMYAAEWSSNAGDFPSTAAYSKWFRTAGVSHPLSGFRVEKIGEHILREPEQYYPDKERIQVLLQIATDLVKAGKGLQNIETQRALKQSALGIDVARLAVHRKAAAPITPPLSAPLPTYVSPPAATDAADVPAAARAGDLVSLTKLLAADPALVNRKDSSGRAPLMYAVEGRHVEVVRFLLAHGGDVNDAEEDGTTPFGDALATQNTAIVKLMLAKGATVNPEGRPNLTPLVVAVVKNYEEGARLLLAHGAKVDAKVGGTVGMRALEFAAEFGYTRLAELLLQHGADVNAADAAGFTALHHAVVRGHEDLVRMLLKRGADVNRKAAGETTPLHDAAATDALTIARALVARGANVHAKDLNGDTPCQTARRAHAEDVADYLCGINAP